MFGLRIPAEIKQKTKGFAACTCSSPGGRGLVRPRTGALFSFAGEESLETRESEFAGRSSVQVRRDVGLQPVRRVLGV